MASPFADKLPVHKRPRTLDEVIDEVMHRSDSLEVVFVGDRRVACMGSGGALGHPKTFYTIGDKGYAECGYCDRVFVLDPEREGEVMADFTEERERARNATAKALPGDGITESATPPPGENLGVSGGSGA
ncbi:zinc-finger domain-containing protein [Parvularcula maris]|uniref:Zinc-finger domain-containing protein n=1 Tax=Parvularcula maris TaxID=2965077 RepID=A0A9X2LAW6_9PROT|nr:zinc-finger domain-containing protein [Parvularcula maris]MCQ8186297.1 zinc-finger domain-containing protein [Parvularcula maris]